MLGKEELWRAVFICWPSRSSRELCYYVGQARAQGSCINMLGKHDFRGAVLVCWKSRSSRNSSSH